MDNSGSPASVGSSEGLGALVKVFTDWPAKWRGVGYAPNASGAVEAAGDSLRNAEEALFQTLKRAYPLGERVAVIHHRGHFYGRVVGWDHYGSRVAVKNEATGKESKWWAAHVQLSA